MEIISFIGHFPFATGGQHEYFFADFSDDSGIVGRNDSGFTDFVGVFAVRHSHYKLVANLEFAEVTEDGSRRTFKKQISPDWQF